jgi:hypothetical protein
MNTGMQRIFELTKAHLMALSNEQIDRFIDVECLLDGVPLVPSDRPVAPEVVKPEPDTEFWTVGSFHFADERQAMVILNELRRSTLIGKSYRNGGGGESCYVIEPLSSYSAPSVTAERAFSQERWDEVSKQVEEYGRAMAVYKERKSEYDSACKKREEASSRVWNYVDSIRTLAMKRCRLKDEFARYVVLASGEKEMAWNFFAVAYPEARDHEGLKEELVPQVTVTERNETE